MSHAHRAGRGHVGLEHLFFLPEPVPAPLPLRAFSDVFFLGKKSWPGPLRTAVPAVPGRRASGMGIQLLLPAK